MAVPSRMGTPEPAGRDPDDDGVLIARSVGDPYVANNQSGSVTPIRVATNKALPPIRTGGYPSAIAIAGRR